MRLPLFLAYAQSRYAYDKAKMEVPICSSFHDKSNRKAMNRNWGNQKANPAPKTKAGNK